MTATGLLIVRVWKTEDGMRARLLEVDEITTAEHTIAVVASPVELATSVLAWAGRVVEDDPRITPTSRGGDESAAR